MRARARRASEARTWSSAVVKFVSSLDCASLMSSGGASRSCTWISCRISSCPACESGAPDALDDSSTAPRRLTAVANCDMGARRGCGIPRHRSEEPSPCSPEALLHSGGAATLSRHMLACRGNIARRGAACVVCMPRGRVAARASSSTSLVREGMARGRAWFEAYDSLLQRHRLATTTVTGGVLAIVGDAFTQAATQPAYDASRGTSFALFGATVTGPVNFLWLNRLDKIVRSLAPQGGALGIGCKVHPEWPRSPPTRQAAAHTSGCYPHAGPPTRLAWPHPRWWCRHSSSSPWCTCHSSSPSLQPSGAGHHTRRGRACGPNVRDCMCMHVYVCVCMCMCARAARINRVPTA